MIIRPGECRPSPRIPRHIRVLLSTSADVPSFAWLWRWLPLRLSKRQSLSPQTVLLRTTLTRMIIIYTYLWRDSWVQTICKRFLLNFKSSNMVSFASVCEFIKSFYDLLTWNVWRLVGIVYLCFLFECTTTENPTHLMVPVKRLYTCIVKWFSKITNSQKKFIRFELILKVNLGPRVLRLSDQRIVARRDPGKLEFNF